MTGSHPTDQTSPPPGAFAAPAVARNRAPIREVLAARLPATGLVLEIASGSGEHAVHNAAAFPDLRWQPTDRDDDALASIAAWRAAANLLNLLAPLRLDASAPQTWPVDRADVVMAINMVHISPWAATEGLFAGAARVLAPAGMLFLYGPYIEADVETTASNLAFDASLQARNAEWGLRHLDAMIALAERHSLSLRERVAMPANNLALCFVRR